MPLENRWVKQRTLEYAANNRDVEPIDRGGLIHGAALRLVGQTTVSSPASNNQPGDILRGDAWGLIRSFRIRVNSNDDLYDLSGPSMIKDAYFLGSGKHVVDSLGQLGDSTTANPAFDSTLYIPFAPPRWRAAAALADYALDTRRMAKLEFEVNWNDHLALNPNATGFQSVPRIECELLFAFPPDGIELAPGFMKRYEQIKELSATNSREQLTFSTGKLYWGHLFNANVDGADNSDVIQNIRLKSGSIIYADATAVMLREAYRQKFGMARGFNGASYDDQMVGDANDLDAWTMYQHPFDGNTREGINTTARASYEVEIDAVKQGTSDLITAIQYEYATPA